MLVAAIVSGARCFLLVLTFDLASAFPHHYMVVMSTGQCLCGILSALVQIASLATFKNEPQHSTLYFGVALAIILIAFVMHLFIGKTQFHRHYYEKYEQEFNEFKWLKFFSVVRKCKGEIINIVVLMACAKLVEPSLTYNIKSVTSGTDWSDVYFVPVISNLLANTLNFIGRESVKLFTINDIWIRSVCSVLSINFIPLLIFCNVQTGRPRIVPVIFGDAAYVFIMSAFIYSSGYLVTLHIYMIIKKMDSGEKSMGAILITILILTTVGIFSFLGPLTLTLISS